MIKTAWDVTDLALAPIRAMLHELENEGESVATTQTSTKHTVQKIRDALKTVVDRVGDALEARLVQLEDTQEKIMGAVEGIKIDRELKDDEEEEKSATPPHCLLPLFGFPPLQLEGFVQSSLPLVTGVVGFVTLQRLSKLENGNLQRKRHKGIIEYRAAL